MSMKNVDVEVYLTNLINFFEKNPNDLMETYFYDIYKDNNKNINSFE